MPDQRAVKTMSLRLPAELADRLEAVADVEGRPIADVVRDAIAALVDERRRDPEFQKRLKESVARHQRLLRLLKDD